MKTIKELIETFDDLGRPGSKQKELLDKIKKLLTTGYTLSGDDIEDLAGGYNSPITMDKLYTYTMSDESKLALDFYTLVNLQGERESKIVAKMTPETLTAIYNKLKTDHKVPFKAGLLILKNVTLSEQDKITFIETRMERYHEGYSTDKIPDNMIPKEEKVISALANLVAIKSYNGHQTDLYKKIFKQVQKHQPKAIPGFDGMAAGSRELLLRQDIDDMYIAPCIKAVAELVQSKISDEYKVKIKLEHYNKLSDKLYLNLMDKIIDYVIEWEVNDYDYGHSKKVKKKHLPADIVEIPTVDDFEKKTAVAYIQNDTQREQIIRFKKLLVACHNKYKVGQTITSYFEDLMNPPANNSDDDNDEREDKNEQLHREEVVDKIILWLYDNKGKANDENIRATAAKLIHWLLDPDKRGGYNTMEEEASEAMLTEIVKTMKHSEAQPKLPGVEKFYTLVD